MSVTPITMNADQNANNKDPTFSAAGVLMHPHYMYLLNAQISIVSFCGQRK